MTIEAGVSFSVSTWRQPLPPTQSPNRACVLVVLAEIIDRLGDQRVRIAIDGLTASGKTSLGHELAHLLARRGRPVLRASLDDFKRPWSDRHLYDRLSGEGYYRNAFDYDTARKLLLDPSDRKAEGIVSLCSIDPITQVEHSAIKSVMPPNGVLVVDGVFAFRPEVNRYAPIARSALLIETRNGSSALPIGFPVQLGFPVSWGLLQTRWWTTKPRPRARAERTDGCV